MPLIPIRLPPGMYKNGTPYTRKLRWADGNLVRWHDGSIRPVGGWIRRVDSAGDDIDLLYADPDIEAVRDIFAWVDNGQGQNVVFGSNKKLYHLDGNGLVTDVTYAGFTPANSSKDADAPTGYGAGRYGGGAFGVSSSSAGTKPLPPDRWYFDNFGEILLTGVRGNGGIYEIDPSTLTPSAVTNAPTQAQDLCVTDERQVMVVGADGDPRRLRMSEVEDRTDWTPAVDNQSVDRTIPGTGRLLRCLNVLGQNLLIGENDAHVVRYIGPPYVVSVDLAGENCGPVATEAVARTERFAVWWGDRNFWIYDGNVKQLPCEVIDFLYDDIAPDQISKISTFTNTQYSEVWWLYQAATSSTGEIDSYVTWNYVANTWTTGRLARTAGVDKGVVVDPILVSPSGGIFNHELDTVLATGDVFVESGAIELGNGEQNMAVRFIYPDTETNSGNITYHLITRQFPNATEHTFGPYDFGAENPIATTGVLGRTVKLRIDINEAQGEAGHQRLEVAPIGTGKR